MTVSDFTRKDFLSILPYTGVHSIKHTLKERQALVVQDEDDGNPLGVLTAMDIVQHSHNLVIDCISPKPNINATDTIEHALKLMHHENSDVLPVYHEGVFEGLLYKNDLIHFLSLEKRELEEVIISRNTQLNHINVSLESSQRVLNAIFDSTSSIKLLVSQEHKLMFFNKKAYTSFKDWYGIKLEVNDSILDYWPGNGNDQLRNLFQEEFQRALQGEKVQVDRKLTHNLKESTWFRIEYVPVYEGDERIGVAITFIDINESKKFDIHIQHQNSILREIAWIQSHKMRGPVATILGLINLLEVNNLSEENQELVKLLRHTVKELDGVIHKIVDKTNELDEVL